MTSLYAVALSQSIKFYQGVVTANWNFQVIRMLWTFNISVLRLMFIMVKRQLVENWKGINELEIGVTKKYTRRILSLYVKRPEKRFRYWQNSINLYCAIQKPQRSAVKKVEDGNAILLSNPIKKQGNIECKKKQGTLNSLRLTIKY